MSKLKKLLLGVLLSLALGLALLAMPGKVAAQDSCTMTVAGLPAGAMVDIYNGPQNLTNGQTFAVTSGADFRLAVGSQWVQRTVAHRYRRMRRHASSDHGRILRHGHHGPASGRRGGHL